MPSSLVPRRSRLGHSWTLPWAVTSPRDTGPLSARLSADNGIKRERLGTSLSAVYFFGGKCLPKTTCKGVGAGWWVCFQRRCCCTSVYLCIPGNFRRSINNQRCVRDDTKNGCVADYTSRSRNKEYSFKRSRETITSLQFNHNLIKSPASKRFQRSNMYGWFGKQSVPRQENF